MRLGVAWAAVLALLALPAYGGVQFQDRSDALPLAHVYDGGWEHFVGGGVAVFDCNGDAFADLFVAGGANPAHLFVNTTGKVGGDLTFGLGAFPKLTGVTGAYPLDIDGDGILDLAVLRVGVNRLLRGHGDCTFSEAGALWGFASADHWTTAFSAIWETGHQRPTLVFGNYVDRHNPEGPFGTCDASQLYRATDGRYGAPLAIELGFCTLSVLISDWARTGRRDLRLSNDRQYYLRGGSEQMLRLDTLAFLGPDDGWPELSIWGMGIASRDITGDGIADVMLTSMGDQNMQLAGADGTYTAVPFSFGTAVQRPGFGGDGRPSTGWHAEFGDVDNDGADDLFITKGNVDQMPGMASRDPNNLLMRVAPDRFEDHAQGAGVATMARSRGAALYDLNLDGRLDLVVVNRRAPLEVHQNVTPDAGNWLLLDIAAPALNTHAVGAWIELRRADGAIVSREITVGGGHAGGQAGYHHFGLGRDEDVAVRLLPPVGAPTAWLPVEANRRVRLMLSEDGRALRRR